MAVSSSIDIKEGIHLPLGLVLIIVVLSIVSGLLVATVVTVEMSYGAIVSNNGLGKSGCGKGGFGGFCLFFLPLSFLGIVRVGVIVAMDGGIVASILALGRRRSARGARAAGRGNG